MKQWMVQSSYSNEDQQLSERERRVKIEGQGWRRDDGGQIVNSFESVVALFGLEKKIEVMKGDLD